MGREVGVGFRMENTCTPMVDSCQRMAKPIQYCKVISLPKINKLKKYMVFVFPCLISLSIIFSRSIHIEMAIFHSLNG